MSLDSGLLPKGELAHSAGSSESGEWECMECGYIEAGAHTRRPKACPECGAPSLALEFFPNEDEDDEASWGETIEDSDDLYEDIDSDEDDDAA